MELITVILLYSPVGFEMSHRKHLFQKSFSYQESELTYHSVKMVCADFVVPRVKLRLEVGSHMPCTVQRICV